VLFVTVLADLLALTASFLLAFHLHFLDKVLVLSAAPADFARYVLAMAVLAPLWLLVFAARGMYAGELLLHGIRLTGRVLETTAIAGFASLSGVYLTGGMWLSRGWFVATTVLSVGLVIVGRRLVLLGLLHQRRRRPWRLLLLGASQIGESAARMLARRSDVAVVGFLDDYLPLGIHVGGTHRVLGRPADVEQVALAERVDELLVVEGALAQESYDRLLRDAYTSPALPPLRLIPSVAGELVARLQPAYRGRVPILIPDLGGVGAPGMLSKVLLDRSLALLLLLVASPLLLALWLGARLHGLTLLQYTSMVGRQGRPFARLSLQAWWRPGQFADRTLRLSTFPQRFRLTYLLTKLPRLINVLRGDLSIVGPRAISKAELTLYSEWVGVLLAMQPGLIGPWLLHGKSALSVEEEVQADLAYVRDYTLLQDLAIMARTSRQIAALLWRRTRRVAVVDGAGAEEQRPAVASGVKR